MTERLHHVRASLGRPDSVPALCIFARSVVAKMTDSPWFPAPTPPLAKVMAAIVALEDAQTAVQSRARGAASSRTAAKAKLVGLLNRLKAYVQGVADDDAESAAAIVEAASMGIVPRGDRPKQDIVVRQGRVSGEVRIVLRAVAKLAGYEFQASRDAGKTWVDLPKTLQAKTTVPNLEPATTYLFRYRVVTRRDGVGDWSPPVAFVVR